MKNKKPAPKVVQEEVEEDQGDDFPDLGLDEDQVDPDEVDEPAPPVSKKKGGKKAAPPPPEEDEEAEDDFEAEIDQIDEDDLDDEEVREDDLAGLSLAPMLEKLGGLEELVDVSVGKVLALLGKVQGDPSSSLGGVTRLVSDLTVKVTEQTNLLSALVGRVAALEKAKGEPTTPKPPAAEKPPEGAGEAKRGPANEASKPAANPIPPGFDTEQIKRTLNLINKQTKKVTYQSVVKSLAERFQCPEPEVSKLLIHLGFPKDCPISPGTLTFEAYQKNLNKKEKKG